MGDSDREQYQQFWKGLIGKLKKLKRTGIRYFGGVSHCRGNWLKATAWKVKKKGQTGVFYGFILNKGSAYVQFYLDDGKGFRGMNQRRYNALVDHKGTIEGRLGTHLDWRGGEGLKTASIVKQVSNSGLDDTDKWDEIQDTMVDEMTKLIKVFEPYV